LRYALFLVLAMGLAFFISRGRSGPEPGSEAAAFDLPVVAGNQSRFRLADQRGTPVVVEVFASWCGVCRRTAPMLSDAANARRERPVRFVGVSVDQTESAAKAAKAQWGISYDVAIDDGRFSKNYGITVLPTIILIDGDGRVRHVSAGAPRQSELESWLDDVGAARL
jgi:peroxiredoxin